MARYGYVHACTCGYVYGKVWYQYTKVWYISVHQSENVCVDDSLHQKREERRSQGGTLLLDLNNATL